MSELDELLKPTIAPQEARPLPWRVSSQFWVAFFGGVPAVTLIAFLNARRLGVEASRRRWILVAGVVCFAITIGLMAWLGVKAEHRTSTRLAARVVAVLLFFVFARIQRDEDGRHQVFGPGRYDSLWGPGIAAMVFGWVVTFVAAFPVVLALR